MLRLYSNDGSSEALEFRKHSAENKLPSTDHNDWELLQHLQDELTLMRNNC